MGRQEELRLFQSLRDVCRRDAELLFAWTEGGTCLTYGLVESVLSGCLNKNSSTEAKSRSVSEAIVPIGVVRVVFVFGMIAPASDPPQVTLGIRSQ